ncbi:MAG: MnhB domain-containing protein [Clostridia bacterium]|jgi:multicomponent Na+:H+ antiporter subunit B|nr:MnhB domain-containing protein [Clostridia bacterium]
MKNKNNLILTLIELIYPLILLFGFYIILYGDISPGGGFQGGAILASAFILRYVAYKFNKIQLGTIQNMEKYFYILIILVPFLSILTRQFALTNFLKPYGFERFFLIFMNLLIGLKVCLGITIIFYEFILHERRWSQ